MPVPNVGSRYERIGKENPGIGMYNELQDVQVLSNLLSDISRPTLLNR
jgi:hypothetical protein